MKALVYHGPDNISLENVPMPVLLLSTDAIIKISTTTICGTNFTVNNIPQNRGVVYVDDSNPELLKVTISVSWKQGNTVVGEDRNLDGSLNAGEDSNGNGILDSPVELTTLIVNR